MMDVDLLHPWTSRPLASISDSVSAGPVGLVGVAAAEHFLPASSFFGTNRVMIPSREGGGGVVVGGAMRQ